MQSLPTLDDLDSLLENPLNTPKKLKEAFSLFSTHTDELIKAYGKLENKCLAISSDLVHTQKKLQAQLLELTQTQFHLQALIDHMAEGLIFIKQDGVISSCSPKTYELLDLAPTPIGAHYSQALDDHFFGFSIESCLTQKQAPSASILTLPATSLHRGYKVLRIATSYIDLKNEALAIPHKLHAVTGLLILISDITEFQQLQAINQRGQRLKEIGELAASLAHEIRNPLAAIEGFSSLLLRDLEGSPSKELAQSIVQASKLLNRHIDHVLHYARAIAAKLEYSDLVETVHLAMESIKVIDSIGPRHTFISQLPDQPLWIDHDRDLVHSCIIHLCRNAFQAVDEEGTVILSLKTHKNEAWIEVRDNGPGIIPGDLDKIFQPFFTTKSQGNGLGLCEVSKMMSAQNGRVEVSSLTSPDSVTSNSATSGSATSGTLFTLKLPLHSPLACTANSPCPKKI